jgi:CHAD domain-containing protein
MDYSFRRDETSADAARRIASEQLEGALSELCATTEVDKSVHGVRKRLKKLRGLLQLLEGALGRRVVARENRCYRDAARALAGARRAAAIVAAFDALMQRCPDAIPAEARAELRGGLIAERDRLVALMQGGSQVPDVTAALRASVARLESWPLEVEGWQVLRSGFRRSYARGRRALKVAMREPTTENLHEWRKFAKHYWYHVRLLARLWPEAMKVHEAALERLGDDLGDEHDLDDLRLSLIAHMPPEQLREATGRVLAAIEARRDELRASAFARGRYLYAERPRAATERVGAYHAAWLARSPGPGDDADRDG